jgi:acetolactate synthase I/II/III large subunit
VLYVGGGVIRAGRHAELRALAELTGIPVVTTLMARGAFPDSHPQHLGMPGMHGTVAAVDRAAEGRPAHRLGARFDDRVTGKLSTLRARTPRSSTPTSTRPRSARTAGRRADRG